MCKTNRVSSARWIIAFFAASMVVPMVLGANTRPCRVGQNRSGCRSQLVADLSRAERPSGIAEQYGHQSRTPESADPGGGGAEEAGVFSPQGWALRPAPIGP